MWVDPNQSVGRRAVHVLCRSGSVELLDGTTVSTQQLASSPNAFETWCRTLDPNISWISAFLAHDREKEVFFAARVIAGRCGVHMQATIEQPDVQLRQWETLKRHQD